MHTCWFSIFQLHSLLISVESSLLHRPWSIYEGAKSGEQPDSIDNFETFSTMLGGNRCLSSTRNVMVQSDWCFGLGVSAKDRLSTDRGNHCTFHAKARRNSRRTNWRCHGDLVSWWFWIARSRAICRNSTFAFTLSVRSCKHTAWQMSCSLQGIYVNLVTLKSKCEVYKNVSFCKPALLEQC